MNAQNNSIQIQGNWAYNNFDQTDNSIIYSEIWINDSVIDHYDHQIGNASFIKYKFENDTIHFFRQNQNINPYWSAKVRVITPDSMIWQSENFTYQLLKIDTTEYTIDKWNTDSRILQKNFSNNKRLNSTFTYELGSYFNVWFNRREILFNLKANNIEILEAINGMNNFINNENITPWEKHFYTEGLNQILEINNNR